MMYIELVKINERPAPFSCYTAKELWTDAYTSKRMLEYHLDSAVDISSRRAAFISQSIEWMIPHFSLGDHTDVIDFGCGPGLYVSGLAARGISVTGVDFSANSVKYAREFAAENDLDVTYVNEDYLSYETESQYDLILMIMCDFCALSVEQRACMLSKFRRLLKDGGHVLLDVYSLSAFDKRTEGASYEVNSLKGFWAPPTYYGFLNTFKYESEKVTLDKYTIVEKDRTRTVYNWLQYFTPEGIAREFEQAGLRLDTRFADVSGTPYDETSDEFAVVAMKD